MNNETKTRRRPLRWREGPDGTMYGHGLGVHAYVRPSGAGKYTWHARSDGGQFTAMGPASSCEDGQTAAEGAAWELRGEGA